ncbi:unnamed protein product [Cyprideis torosa]|uniref:Replication factor C subunit 1 n=1 Tax=Cyprideis torosa TaxID=163714 RepID=A0A7R8ZH32_9CRUS|nr:unnamed protein product [Cyprideis torosa]CAG0881638.1 unnamed protein product [Cyprideis torosa]
MRQERGEKIAHRVAVPKRANKNRPREVSARRPPGSREVVAVSSKAKHRDPRFDPLCGDYKPELWKKSYSFIEDMRKEELETVKNQMKDETDEEKRERMKDLVKRMQNQANAREVEEAREERKKKAKQEAIEALKQGRKPFFKSDAHLRKEELEEKYKKLKSSGELKKFLEKKKKRLSSSERKAKPNRFGPNFVLIGYSERMDIRNFFNKKGAPSKASSSGAAAKKRTSKWFDDSSDEEGDFKGPSNKKEKKESGSSRKDKAVKEVSASDFFGLARRFARSCVPKKESSPPRSRKATSSPSPSKTKTKPPAPNKSQPEEPKHGKSPAGPSKSKPASPARGKKKGSHPNLEVERAPATPKAIKIDESDSGSHHKKKLSSNQVRNYVNFLHREGPTNPGSKEVPEGAPGCFEGLTFVVSGVMDSLQREEVDELIKKYGGRHTTSISKKTSYLLAGRDAGPKKLEVAETLGTKVISEDDFLEMLATLRGKDGQPPPPRKPPSASVDPMEEEEEEEEEEAPTEPPVPSTSKQEPASTDLLTKFLAFAQLKRPPTYHYGGGGGGDGAFFKAALLSGPPGVGKTTTAVLVAREAGLDTVEFNASDTRNKKALQEQVGCALGSMSVANLMTGRNGSSLRKPVLVMDEVDGMAGNEDRAGIGELIALIKQTTVPIICICNDRHHPKIRSLVNHCYDLQFPKPSLQQITGAMMTICSKYERMNMQHVKPDMIREIVSGAQHDVRQTLHHLSLWVGSAAAQASESVGKLPPTREEVKREAERSHRDVTLGPFETVRRVFSAEYLQGKSLNEKAALFFHDYSMGPLFVHENYLNARPKVKGKAKEMKLLSLAADSLCMGDLIEKEIRSSQSWSLLPVEAIFASVLPGEHLQGQLDRPSFPSWLGKNSSQKKCDRLLQEIQTHLRLRVSGSKNEVLMDYVQAIRDKIYGPLVQKANDEGVKEAVDKKRGVGAGLVEEDEEDADEEEEGEDEGLEGNALIKKKEVKGSRAASTSSSSAGSSRGGKGSRGRGKK